MKSALEVQEWIQREMMALTRDKHTRNDQALAYMVGFLSAQLAQAMWADTNVTGRFRRALTSARTGRKV